MYFCVYMSGYTNKVNCLFFYGISLRNISSTLRRLDTLNDGGHNFAIVVHTWREFGDGYSLRDTSNIFILENFASATIVYVW